MEWRGSGSRNGGDLMDELRKEVPSFSSSPEASFRHSPLLSSGISNILNLSSLPSNHFHYHSNVKIFIALKCCERN